jgi:hypothetical protein
MQAPAAQADAADWEEALRQSHDEHRLAAMVADRNRGGWTAGCVEAASASAGLLGAGPAAARGVTLPLPLPPPANAGASTGDNAGGPPVWSLNPPARRSATPLTRSSSPAASSLSTSLGARPPPPTASSLHPPPALPLPLPGLQVSPQLAPHVTARNDSRACARSMQQQQEEEEELVESLACMHVYRLRLGARVLSVACGGAHTLAALANAAGVWAWGSNAHGQLGIAGPLTADSAGTGGSNEGQASCALTLVPSPVRGWLGLAWLGLAWLGLAWLGLAWLGLAWLGLAWLGLAGGHTVGSAQVGGCTIVGWFSNSDSERARVASAFAAQHASACRALWYALSSHGDGSKPGPFALTGARFPVRGLPCHSSAMRKHIRAAYLP